MRKVGIFNNKCCFFNVFSIYFAAWISQNLTSMIKIFGIHQRESKTLSSNNYLRSFTHTKTKLSKLPPNLTHVYLTKRHILIHAVGIIAGNFFFSFKKINTLFFNSLLKDE